MATKKISEMTPATTLNGSELVPIVQGVVNKSATITLILGPTNVKYYGAVGNGIADDTIEINAALASGHSPIYLPEGTYLVSDTLLIPSNTSLILDADATIKLVNGSNCHVIENSDFTGGNVNIEISGGIWDGNGLNQTDDAGDDPDKYYGTLMQFRNINGVKLHNVTIKDPKWFGVHVGKIVNFTIGDINFDYRLAGGDGLHFSGLCKYGYVYNIKDLYGALRDDILPFNADDVPKFNITPGELSDIDVRGVYMNIGTTTGGFKSGVRFLSVGSQIHDIKVEGIYGGVDNAVVQIDNFGLGTHDSSIIYNISIYDVYCTMITNDSLGLINIKTNVKNITINNITYKQIGIYTKPMVAVQSGAIVDEMIINGVKFYDESTNGFTGIQVLGSTIKKLIINNCLQQRSAIGSNPFLQLSGGATINECLMNNMVFTNIYSLLQVQNLCVLGSIMYSNIVINKSVQIIQSNVEDSTATINNIYISNMEFTPDVSSDNIFSFLYTQGSAIRIKTSNLNLTTFAGNIIQKHLAGTEISLMSNDFYVDPIVTLTPIEGDIVSSNKAGKTKGPAYYNGTNWISMVDASVIS